MNGVRSSSLMVVTFADTPPSLSLPFLFTSSYDQFDNNRSGFPFPSGAYYYPFVDFGGFQSEPFPINPNQIL